MIFYSNFNRQIMQGLKKQTYLNNVTFECFTKEMRDLK